MKKIMVVLLVVLLSTTVSAYEWVCMGRGDSVSFFTCQAECCILCVDEQGFSSDFRRCEGPMCSCGQPMDGDFDGVDDYMDNCDGVSNPGQEDLDGDGIGDACDPQTCGNQILEEQEECEAASDCNDSDPYTIDTCEECSCSHQHMECIVDQECAYLDESLCDSGILVEKQGVCLDNSCTTDTITQNCSELDILYCDGTQIIEETYTCTDADCVASTSTIEECNDGIYCNGQESCDNAQCVSGTPVECSDSDLPEISKCNNDPDNNQYTLDYASSFTSVCDEQIDSCTTGTYSFTHSCDVLCGAECTQKSDCIDKCVGDLFLKGGICSQCVCEYVQEDCNQYDGYYDTANTRWVDLDQCNQEEQKEQEYRDYTCSQGCDYQVTGNNWTETGNTRPKQDGSACDDSLYCTINDMCVSGSCSGAERDCSGNNLPEISTCTNNPDNNPYTLDHAPSYTSMCDEEHDLCETASHSFTHTCDMENCNAECQTDSDCDATTCSQLNGCYNGTYRVYLEIWNTCQDCLCTQNPCGQYNDIVTDKDGDGYDIECDGDCDDKEPKTYPGAQDICDKKDNDCDGVTDEDCTPLEIHSCGHTIVYGVDLVDPEANYAFEGETITWDLLVVNRYPDEIQEVSMVLGGEVNVLCTEVEKNISKCDGENGSYFKCQYTVEKASERRGSYEVTATARSDSELTQDLDSWFFNPTVSIEIDNGIDFGSVEPGTRSVADPITITNGAEAGSQAKINMFISGTDMTSTDPDSECPEGPVLDLENFDYKALRGFYTSSDDNRSDSQGYIPIKMATSFDSSFYNSNEILQLSPENGLYRANILSPEESIILYFRLNLPQPCHGSFSQGSIYFWGELV